MTPYELRHLAAHLEAAGRAADLHRLLAHEGDDGGSFWYAARAGDVAGYLADVGRGWRAARSGSAGGSGGDAVACWTLEVRYALTSATLASLAAAVPPALLVHLVSTGLWTVDEAVALARRVPDLEQRAEALMAVVSGTGLDAAEVERLHDEALSAALALPDAYRRASALTRLAPSLPPAVQRRLYTAAAPDPAQVEHAYATGMSGRATDGTVVANLTGEAAVVRSWLADLEHATVDQALAALRGVLSLSGELQRTLALARLVPRLVELGLEQQARSAAATVTATTRDERARSRLRAAVQAGAGGDDLAPRWSAELLAEHLDRADDPRAAAAQALHASQAVGDAERVDELVAATAALLAATGDLAGARGMLAGIGSAHWSSALAVRLARLEPDGGGGGGGGEPAGADRSADDREFGDPVTAVLLAASAARRRPVEQREAALTDAVSAARRLPDPHLRSRALAGLLQTSPEAVDLVRGDGDEADPLVQDAVAGAYAFAGRAGEALAVVDAVEDLVWRHAVLHTVVRRLARSGCADTAIQLAGRLPEPSLTPALAVDLVVGGGSTDPVLGLLEGVQDALRRAACLAGVAAHTALDGRDPVLARTLDALADGGGGPDAERTLLLAAAAGAPRARCSVLAAALPDPDARTRALAALDLLDDPARLSSAALDGLSPAQRCRVHLDVADVVTGAARQQALEAAAGLLRSVTTDAELLRVCRALRAGPPVAAAVQARVWSEVLESAGAGDRERATRLLQELLGVAMELGGRPLLLGLVQALRQVARWWP